jgi:hypothetical protein
MSIEAVLVVISSKHASTPKTVKTGGEMHRAIILGLLLSGTALADPVPLYRLYSGSSSDHFYTTSMDEAFRATSYHGYAYEGISGKCMPTQEWGTTPLYRMYSGSAGDHFYTTSWQERDTAIAWHGYSNEGVACYVYSWQASGTCPLYRMWRSRGGDHFYTLSWQEVLNAGRYHGYAYEGVAAYLFPETPGQCPQ